MTNPEGSLIPTRSELMERIEAAWSELDQAISGLDHHQLSTKPADGGWSIKDHVAHLAVWSRSAAALVAGESRPEAMGIDSELWDQGDEDDLNAAIGAQWSGQSAADALVALRAAQSRLRDLIGGMSDDDLALPYSHFQPDSPPYNPNPVVGWIAGNTFGHIEMHLPAMQEIRRQVT